MKKFIIFSLITISSLTVFAENDPLDISRVFPYKSKTEALLINRNDSFIGIMAYDQNYLMETFSNKNFAYDRSKMNHDELKFQISLALPIWKNIFGKNSVLAGTYTQRSWFQLTNKMQSSPFRESNYEPQIFLAWVTKHQLPFGWTMNDFETGFNHESNGRGIDELKSRSWNRLYVRASASKGNWILELKPWWRIPEKSKDDDNPDITKYKGYFDLTIGYRYNKHQFKIKGHFNPRSQKGGIEATYTYPLTKYIRLYTQYYGGYGESLIDYQKNIQRIGIGISLNNVF
ncbi:phospholipase A1 [Bisgaardia hudsonensis]|uniref:Phospholipase A1 n=1 Tax=Bisgaardia hudsonensis TaxID=109472 RepID=A0A4R2N1H7_9PAST|nr:phospholipase A [Bisgaardia hudsonensis]QLB13047.1 phospholipase [Bisgaardia hudsonensis]TCP13388.1 phospholipase A1 [Bisgaardia hudsonensis]